MPKLIAMLRVKDGILFVKEWLERTAALVDEIVVVDNGSTDGTLEILQQHPSVVCIERTIGFDEGRDKILAYERVRQRKPDWVLWLDIDEIFERGLTRKHFDRLMASPVITRFFFRRFHMIDSAHFNVSPYWIKLSCWPDRVLWREQKTGYFSSASFNNGLIQGIHGLQWISHYRIRHLGYIDKEYVERKTNIYRSIDPTLEGTYTRMQHIDPIGWKWREYSESPVLVSTQNILMDTYLAFRYASVAAMRVQKRIRDRFSLPRQNNVRL